MSDEIMTSRSGNSNNIGKCTEEVRTRIPYAVKEGLARLVNESGMSEAEYVREVLVVHVLGVDAVRQLNEEKLQRVAGIGMAIKE